MYACVCVCMFACVYCPCVCMVCVCVCVCVKERERERWISPSVNCHTMLKAIDNVALLSWKKCACVCMDVGGHTCMCTRVKIQYIWCYYSFHFYSDAPQCWAHFLYKSGNKSASTVFSGTCLHCWLHSGRWCL